MKMAVVLCDCGNPEPHRIFRTEYGRETKGFFSLAEGKRMHARILASGDVEQTGEEKTATEQELASCGLPEENLPPTLGSPAAARPPLGEGPVGTLAAELKKFPPADHWGMIGVAVIVGVLTAEEGERILALTAAG